MSFSPDSGSFELRYNISTTESPSIPTQINLSPTRTYPSGFEILISPAGAATWKLSPSTKEMSAHWNDTVTQAKPQVRTIGYPPMCVETAQEQCGRDYYNNCRQCQSSYECGQCCDGCEL